MTKPEPKPEALATLVSRVGQRGVGQGYKSPEAYYAEALLRKKAIGNFLGPIS
jgi:hypothetical protein